MSEAHSPRAPSRLRRAGLLGLIAALSLCLVPGVADAAKGKKKKSQPIVVGSYNLYLGSDLNPPVVVASTPLPGAAHVDAFANEVGFVVNDVNFNNFNNRAIQIAKDIIKQKADLVGLQEAALWKVQLPTDGGAASAANPTAARANLVLYDYVQALLAELNKGAKTKKQCKQKGLTGAKCYQGYFLASSTQEADIEFPGDFDNNPGPDGIAGAGFGPAAPPCAGGPPFQGGNDDTGNFFGDPNGPLDLNGDTAAGCATPEAFSDCADTNPAAAGFGASIGVQPLHTCLFHGVDGDASLTMRDAIIARKGNGVKASGPQGRNYVNMFSVPVLGSTVNFLRGWTSVEAKVRGKSFRFLNTHLEAVDNLNPSGITFREAQAREIVAPGGPGTVPSVLVGDLNSDPASADPLSPPAYNALGAFGYRSLTALTPTSGHPELLNVQDALSESRIDHILTNITGLKGLGSTVVDTFANGFYNSDHGGVFAKIQGQRAKAKKK